MSAAPVTFSIIVPTFNRRDVVLRGVESIVAARMPWQCELIVVVDGSTDGTAEALAALTLPIPLQVITQANAGAAAARNRGARAATGKYLLFLDDDMSIDGQLLVEHEKSLAAGADAVVGDIPLDPDSPPTLLTRGVARWSDHRRRRLRQAHGQLTVSDFLTGQLSVRASAFADVAGFDEALTAGGSFGGEDTDFVYRLLQSTSRVTYNPAAISYQRYVVTPAQNMRQWSEAGRHDAMLSRKHPGLGAVLFDQHHGSTPIGRLARWAAALNPAVLDRLRSRIVRRVAAGRCDPGTEFAYARLRDVGYWAGTRAGGGIARQDPGAVRILAYHAVDRVEDPIVGRYSVDPVCFEEQITALLARGYTFIDVDRLLAHLHGGEALAPRSVLLSFDDGYESLIRHAAPILARLAVPAVVCVVTSQLGGHNAWDEAHGAARLPLLDVQQLSTLSRAGWEIASHTHTHPHLTRLRAAALTDELARSRARLTSAGLPGPRLIAYPHGEHDLRVRRFARRAGYTAGLALQGPTGDLRTADRYALPRVEVLNAMSAADLVHLLDTPTAAPHSGLGRELRAVARLALDVVERPWRRRPGTRAGLVVGPDIDRRAIG